MRFSGLASGLARAVRPAGSAEAPGSTARRRRVPRSGMRSTVEAGGADSDNARRSDPIPVTFRLVTSAPGESVTVWLCARGAILGTVMAGTGSGRWRASRARQPPRP